MAVFDYPNQLILGMTLFLFFLAVDLVLLPLAFGTQTKTSFLEY
jgi:hypothetical protein